MYPEDIERKFMLFAEGDEGDAGGSGGADNQDGEEAIAPDESGKTDGKEAVSADTAPSWKDSLTSDATKKFAEGSPDLEHLTERAVKMREQLTNAIIPPGKDATDTEVAAYRKKIGVPESSEGYKIKMPEGQTETEIDKAFHASLSEKFFELNVPAKTAEALNALVNDHTMAMQQMIKDEDARFAEESEAELRKMWPDNYDENVVLAKHAMKEMFPGDLFDELNMTENKQGKMITDMPIVLRSFAVLGKEMVEGGLAAPMSEGERTTAENKIQDIRTKISEANERGDSKTANKLYQEEQRLLDKTAGNQGIVGSQGRAA